jgi:hypothetical protein
MRRRKTCGAAIQAPRVVAGAARLVRELVTAFITMKAGYSSHRAP